MALERVGLKINVDKQEVMVNSKEVTGMMAIQDRRGSVI